MCLPTDQAPDVRDPFPHLDQRPHSVPRMETGRLINALDLLEHHRGHVLELTGEPGSGKTHLLAELTATAEESGVRVIRGRCSEPEQRVPFHTLAMLIANEPLAGAIRALPDTEARALRGIIRCDHDKTGKPNTPNPVERLRIYRETRALLEQTTERATLVVIDDFHWVDFESAGLIEYLARWPVGAPLLVVIAHRPCQEVTRVHASLAHAAELGTADQIEIKPLSLSESAQILGRTTSDPQLHRLHQESQGNPLYLLVLAQLAGRRGEVSSLPDRGRNGSRAVELLFGEIASLDPVESEVAHAAAVLGDRFDLELLVPVADVGNEKTMDAVTRLERRDLLRPIDSGTEFTLRHSAVRQILYRETLLSWRTQAHRRAYSELCRRGAGAAELARHIERGWHQPGDQETRILVDAAAETMTKDPDTAVRWLSVALRVLPAEKRDSNRLELHLLMVRALAIGGRLVECRELLHSILTTIPTEMTRERVSAVILCTTVESLLGHLAEARSLLVTEAAANNGTTLADVTSLNVANLLVQVLGGMDAESQLVEHLLRHELPDDPLARSSVLALRGLFQVFTPGTGQAAESVRNCTRLLDGMTDTELVGTPEYLLILGWAECSLGLFADSKRHINRVIGLTRKSGQTYLLPILRICLSTAYRHTGPLEEAVRNAQEAKRLTSELGTPYLQGLAMAVESLAVARSDASTPSVALTLAEEAFAMLPPGTNRWSVTATVALTHAALLAGEADRAVSLILNACGDSRLDSVPLIARPLSLEILVLAAISTGQDATNWAELAMASAEKLKVPAQFAFGMAAQAHVLRARHELFKARQAYLRAADLFRDSQMVYDRARMLTFGARCTAALGGTSDAIAILLRANELARTYGADRLTAEIAEKIDELTTDGRRRTTETPSWAGMLGSLTEREREVAWAAATGKRTREIAEELAMSPRTVEVHLTRIYRKLQVPSRAALARLLTKIGRPADRTA